MLRAGSVVVPVVVPTGHSVSPSASLVRYIVHSCLTAGAVASVKGRTKGKDVVPIRCTESTKARKTEVSLGTPLTVCSTTEKWAEVDTSGYHGYILTKHMTLDETE